MSDLVENQSVINIAMRSSAEDLQNLLDEMDDLEREQALQEMAELQAKMAKQVAVALDRMMMGALGLPQELPSDPTHYTHDSTSKVIDV